MSARGPLAIAGALGLLAVSGVAACLFGAVDVPPGQVLAWLLGGGDDPRHGVVVLDLRLPRATLGALVGAALGLAGAAMQGLFRNPLADPYVIGVSSGASLGAAIALVLAVDVSPLLDLATIPAAAFAGALMAAVAVYRLSRFDDEMPLGAVLLAGVAVGLTLSALVALVLLAAEERAGDVMLWLMGHLGGPTWMEVGCVAVTTAVGGLLVCAHTRELDTMLMGEDAAAGLGVDVERAKLLLLGASALLVAGAVAFCGAIGFVGLIVPHAARLACGPSHRWLLPVSALAGAAVLLLADTAARAAFPRGELPVGVVTGCLGGPFFLVLLRRSLSRAGRG